MKRIILISIFLSVIASAYSQNSIEYLYDIHGNRTARFVISVKLDSAEFNKADSTFYVKQEIATDDNTKIELTNSLDNTKINIYPNPAEDILNINIVSDANTAVNKVYIYSVSGQLLFEQVGKNNFQLNISSLTPGIYIVKTNANNIIYNQKIIKK